MQFQRPIWLLNLINGLIFYLVWAIALIAAKDQVQWVGGGVTVAFILFHLFFLTAKRATEAKMVLLALLIGSTLDTVWASLDWVRYHLAYEWLPHFAPFWISALWGYFAITLNHSLNWLKNQLPLASFISFVSAPFCYASAQRMGAVTLPHGYSWQLLIIGASWAFAIPLLVLINRHLAKE